MQSALQSHIPHDLQSHTRTVYAVGIRTFSGERQKRSSSDFTGKVSAASRYHKLLRRVNSRLVGVFQLVSSEDNRDHSRQLRIRIENHVRKITWKHLNFFFCDIFLRLLFKSRRHLSRICGAK